MSIVTDYNAQLALFAGSLEQAQDLGARAEAEAAAERERAKSEAAARDAAAREEFDQLRQAAEQAERARALMEVAPQTVPEDQLIPVGELPARAAAVFSAAHSLVEREAMLRQIEEADARRRASKAPANQGRTIMLVCGALGLCYILLGAIGAV